MKDAGPGRNDSALTLEIQPRNIISIDEYAILDQRAGNRHMRWSIAYWVSDSTWRYSDRQQRRNNLYQPATGKVCVWSQKASVPICIQTRPIKVSPLPFFRRPGKPGGHTLYILYGIGTLAGDHQAICAGHDPVAQQSGHRKAAGSAEGKFLHQYLAWAADPAYPYHKSYWAIVAQGEIIYRRY